MFYHLVWDDKQIFQPVHFRKYIGKSPEKNWWSNLIIKRLKWEKFWNLSNNGTTGSALWLIFIQWLSFSLPTNVQVRFSIRISVPQFVLISHGILNRIQGCDFVVGQSGQVSAVNFVQLRKCNFFCNDFSNRFVSSFQLARPNL